MSKDIVFDNESRRRMQIGINKLADAVGVTLGPRGELSLCCVGTEVLSRGPSRSSNVQLLPNSVLKKVHVTSPSSEIAPRASVIVYDHMTVSQAQGVPHPLGWCCKGVMNASFPLQEGTLSWSSHMGRHWSSTMACRLHAPSSLRTPSRMRGHS